MYDEGLLHMPCPQKGEQAYKIVKARKSNKVAPPPQPLPHPSVISPSPSVITLPLSHWPLPLSHWPLPLSYYPTPHSLVAPLSHSHHSIITLSHAHLELSLHTLYSPQVPIGGEGSTLELFGIWQTEVYTPPPVVDVSHVTLSYAISYM